MNTKKQKLRMLFVSTLYLSAFTFGGGYVIVTLMRKKFVEEYQWIDEKEMLDLIAIAQSAPGAIAVNGAIVVGYKLAGLLGVIVSVVATIIPPFIIISLVSLFYTLFKENLYIGLLLNGMQTGVGAVIIAVVFEMAIGIIKERKVTLFIIMIAVFIANYIFKVNVIFLIITCILLGIGTSLYRERKTSI